MDNRRDDWWCMRVLKRDNIKENKRKKMQRNAKELKHFLGNIAVHFKLSFLKNGSQ